MGHERHRRIWPHDATRTITVRATPEQVFAWDRAARACALPSIGVYLSRSGDRCAQAVKEWEGKR